ncbi:uncharacterized protein MELLADRAFT_87912 [Melampsora larici-populina 98AG31]|uniref:Uncharacterized protein n=1 Tax=Melampsora larici-populina (strain 98AG31 / pathotype 3-4-7) TaxID=747676 RepID=F4RPZ2_MELLP|nr:uncharacterized protein MELLADRAFT_87912 [Melampsora larici-populina 98AG31]EGG05625.1 hypothetical protein MELLADRAFT_87912 [Melampsora larici-populina 98AG31]
MVTKTLIHAHYRLANPNSNLLPLPNPNRKGSSTGLLCPTCSSTMVYLKTNTDSWLIGCPTPNNDHNWKWWRCDQLNHELSLINLGVPRPIVSKPSDWGPRVSPQGQPLEPKPTSASSASRGRHHPYPAPALHPSSDTAGQKKLECNRVYEGKLSQNHKKVANKECPHQYCLGCCTAYGSGICSKHKVLPKTFTPPVTANHGLTPQQVRDLGITHQHLTDLRLPTRGSTPTTDLSVAQRQTPASLARPNQWAQSANSLGRRIPIETMAMIQKVRAEQDQAQDRREGPLVDVNKVATISLWVNSDSPKPITAYFARWPVAYLDESKLLLQAILKVVGPQWDRTLCIWDVTLSAWRDTMVNYPHRCQPNQRTIVVQLPTVDVPASALCCGHQAPPSVQPLSFNGPPPASTVHTPFPPTSAFLSASGLPAVSENTLSQPSTVVINNQQATTSALSQPPKESLPIVPHQTDVTQPTTTNRITTSSLVSALKLSLDLTAPTQSSEQAAPGDEHVPVSQSSSSSVNTQDTTTMSPSPQDVPSLLQKGWPSSSILVSKVLAWYRDSKQGSIKQTWSNHFGGQWKLVPPTVYQYHGWIEDVKPDVMSNHFKNNEQATVGDARLVWAEEFNRRAGVTKKAG